MTSPFRRFPSRERENAASVRFSQTGWAKRDPWALARRLLPQQGAIEVQNDVPGKEHTWHSHDVDETLAIVEGGVRFYWDGGERVCRPGDVIHLPAGMRHGSVALAEGAIYLIAFEAAKLGDDG